MKKLVFLFVLVAALLTGCGKEEVPFTAKNFEADGITALTVDVRDREIQVVASEDEKVRIDYFDSEKEFFNIADEEGSLTMTIADDKEWKDYIGANAPKEHRIIKLHLPEKMLSDLTLTTTNENISLPELTVGDTVTLSANGGNIIFGTLDVGSALTLNVKNGDITGTILGGYDDFDITCTIKKGDTSLPQRKEGGDKTLNVTANNGDVNISFEK